jgi:hypothetical protein
MVKKGNLPFLPLAETTGIGSTLFDPPMVKSVTSFSLGLRAGSSAVVRASARGYTFSATGTGS